MSTIDNLPPLREVINTHDLKARKSLGQNFLLDLNLTAKIARQAGDMTECDVLEIGPGPGGLTRGLLSEGARRVLAIEKDKRCLPALAEIAEAYPDRLTVIEGDALEIDPLAHLTPPIRIAANLPYNVGTELLVRWLTPQEWPDVDVPARGGRADRGQARLQGLWPSGAAGTVAGRCAYRAEPATRGVYPAAQSLLGCGASDGPARTPLSGGS